MKKIITAFLAILFIVACTSKKENTFIQKGIAPISKQVLETAIIYEANIRQYSKEGTFKAFTKDIPQLKELGVKIIWLMPVFPISQTKRKATGGKFASGIKDPKEREKALGSYYAVSDFRKINPEFGNLEDFRALLKTAHANNMYVILDWVPNHTGWDHTWLKTHPEFYTQNEKGEIVHPKDTDWTDVSDLNYNNRGLRAQMIEDMLYWIENENIDGFRCDVAGEVPIDFWEEAIAKLRSKKELFLLAEAWQPELLKDGLFDMAYGWDKHHTLNAIAKANENGATLWDAVFEKDTTRYEKDDILMNFVTNHDENSWNGTIKERMGNAAEVLTVLSYVAPGMPLIYSGQEYDLQYRLKFFEKDSIPKEKGKTWQLLQKLGVLKANNLALHGGKQTASYQRIFIENKNILLFKREKGGKSLYFLANLSDTKQTFKSGLNGDYIDYMRTKKVHYTLKNSTTFNAWEYQILLIE